MPSRGVILRRSRVAGAGLAILVALAAPAAGDEAKRECRDGCQEALRSCKDGCRPERDSGTNQESYLYRQCDVDCQETYRSCMDDCASPDD